MREPAGLPPLEVLELETTHCAPSTARGCALRTTTRHRKRLIRTGCSS
jgi:hypothetical protein